MTGRYKGSWCDAMKNHIMSKIADLLHEHGGTYASCKGCSICTKILKLRPKFDVEPKKRFKHILAKGQEMTRSDINFLLENDVRKDDIQKAINMPKKEFRKMLINFGLVNKKEKGSVEGMSEAITKEKYLGLNINLSEKEKAEILGISYGTLWTLKKSWGVTRPKREKVAEYEAVKEEVKEIVNVDEGVKERLEKRIAELEQEVELYKPFEKQVKDLEAAAGDLENENALHIDKIVELERELNQKESCERWNEILTTENARLTADVKNQQEQINTLISVLGAVAR